VEIPALEPAPEDPLVLAEGRDVEINVLAGLLPESEVDRPPAGSGTAQFELGVSSGSLERRRDHPERTLCGSSANLELAAARSPGKEGRP
jgi:hypothetical protein